MWQVVCEDVCNATPTPNWYTHSWDCSVLHSTVYRGTVNQANDPGQKAGPKLSRAVYRASDRIGHFFLVFKK